MIHIYFFGTLHGYDQYPKSDTIGFTNYYNSSSSSKSGLLIEQFNSKTRYTFLVYGLVSAKEKGREGSFVGISIELDGNYFTEPVYVFNLLSYIYRKDLFEKGILTKAKNAIAFNIQKLEDAATILTELTKGVTEALSKRNQVNITPNEDTKGDSFEIPDYDIDNEIINKRIQRYRQVFINIDYAGIPVELLPTHSSGVINHQGYDSTEEYLQFQEQERIREANKSFPIQDQITHEVDSHEQNSENNGLASSELPVDPKKEKRRKREEERRRKKEEAKEQKKKEKEEAKRKKQEEKTANGQTNNQGDKKKITLWERLGYVSLAVMVIILAIAIYEVTTRSNRTTEEKEKPPVITGNRDSSINQSNHSNQSSNGTMEVLPEGKKHQPRKENYISTLTNTVGGYTKKNQYTTAKTFLRQQAEKEGLTGKEKQQIKALQKRVENEAITFVSNNINVFISLDKENFTFKRYDYIQKQAKAWNVQTVRLEEFRVKSQTAIKSQIDKYVSESPHNDNTNLILKQKCLNMLTLKEQTNYKVKLFNHSEDAKVYKRAEKAHVQHDPKKYNSPYYQNLKK